MAMAVFIYRVSTKDQKLDSRRGGGNPLVKGVKLAGSISRFKKILSILSDFTQYTEYLRNKEVD